MRFEARRSAARAAALLLAWASPALAVDGVIEINQAIALVGGVTATDAPGFPVTIDAPGSYRLTGNLLITGPSDGIALEASNVSLDLNGFEIRGPGTGSGTGIMGIGMIGGFYQQVENGSVRDMGNNGVALGDRSHVENVRAVHNGAAGIFAGVDSLIIANIAMWNGEEGIRTTDSSVIHGNVTTFNTGAGISTFGVCNIIENNVTINKMGGIVAQGQSVIERNTVVANTGGGIQAGINSRVSGNASMGNEGNGILVDSRSLVVGNTASENTQDGINATGEGVRIEGNSLGKNGDDGVQAVNCTGCSITGNTVNGNAYGLFLNFDTVRGGNIISGSTTGDLVGIGLLLECDMVAGVRSCPP